MSSLQEIFFKTKMFIEQQRPLQRFTVFKDIPSTSFRAHEAKVNKVHWNGEGEKLVSASSDSEAKVWDVPGRTCISSYKHKGPVDQAMWSPSDPNLFASCCGGDKAVGLYDIRSNGSVRHLSTKEESAYMCWSPDGSTIGVGSRRDLITFLDVGKSTLIKSWSFKREITAMQWTRAGDYVLLATGSGQLNLMTYPDFKVFHTIEAHSGQCLSVQFDREFERFCTIGSDAMVSVWRCENLAVEKSFVRHIKPPRSASFSHDGEYIAIASADKRIGCDLSHVPSGMHVSDFPSPAAVNSVDWHPKLNILAFAGDELEAVRNSGAGITIVGMGDIDHREASRSQT